MVTVLKQMHDQTLDVKEFPFVEEPKTASKKKGDGSRVIRGAGKDNHNKFRKSDVDNYLENSRLFAFVFGGLSHHEICSVSELQKNLRA